MYNKEYHNLSEADTRAKLIDPALYASDWNENFITREYSIKVKKSWNEKEFNNKNKHIKPDYLLIYKNIKIAVIEAKAYKHSYTEGITQAKYYAEKLNIHFTFSCNGREIYIINMLTGEEKIIEEFPKPQELYNIIVSKNSAWLNKFNGVAFEKISGKNDLRFYQEVAVNKSLEKIANGEKRVLLTLATGTGKTAIASSLSWKIFQSGFNINGGNRQARILFLADRNILADQAINAFSQFPKGSLVRITSKEIKKQSHSSLKIGNVFFTIFQTFMTKNQNNDSIDDDDFTYNDEYKKDDYYFGNFKPDFFDVIIIDECHRAGAKDGSMWRGILEYFNTAIQIGLTATPKRKNNVDTYEYFGEPVYVYSLRNGIDDGYLTPFRVKEIISNIDDYQYSGNDEILQGEIDKEKTYLSKEINKTIYIEARERLRVKSLLKEMNQNEKTIVFCANQEHAGTIRDLINQEASIKEYNYCVRVTSNDGAIGESFLEVFRDNEKSIPTILTTSHKLSTGVDVKNVRNIVLMRSVNDIIEFKQIIGRGTRVFEGKEYFTIYDFEKAYKHFNDAEWDGEPLEVETIDNSLEEEIIENNNIYDIENIHSEELLDDIDSKKEKIKIKLSNNRELELFCTVNTHFYINKSVVSFEDFINNLYKNIPSFFANEHELIKIWQNEETRKSLLLKIEELGIDKNELVKLENMFLYNDTTDLFDILKYLAYNKNPISKRQRVKLAKDNIYTDLNNKEKEFVDFLLEQYCLYGIDELNNDKITNLLEIKYKTIEDSKYILSSNKVAKDIIKKVKYNLYLS